MPMDWYSDVPVTLIRIMPRNWNSDYAYELEFRLCLWPGIRICLWVGIRITLVDGYADMPMDGY